MNEHPATGTDVRADRRMMTLAEVAEYLRVRKITIYRAIKAGDDFGQLRVGRVWRFSRESIVRLVDGEEAAAKTREQPRVDSSGLALRFGHGSTKDGSTE